MITSTPVAFEIQRIGQKAERITADTFETEGTPPKYVFRRKAARILDIFVHALEKEPKAIFRQTPEASVAWRAFVQKQGTVNNFPQLQR